MSEHFIWKQGVDLLKKHMASNPISNYVIPGLTSSLIGDGEGHGKVRLFSQSRMHEEPICPHSHRFSFMSIVLQGTVKQHMWYAANATNPEADLYSFDKLVKDMSEPFGKYNRHKDVRQRYMQRVTKEYKQGDAYYMSYLDIHSIEFSKNAEVLFLEGPEVYNESIIMQPIIDGEIIPTFKVEPWMFQRKGN